MPKARTQVSGVQSILDPPGGEGRTACAPPQWGPESPSPPWGCRVLGGRRGQSLGAKGTSPTSSEPRAAGWLRSAALVARSRPPGGMGMQWLQGAVGTGAGPESPAPGGTPVCGRRRPEERSLPPPRVCGGPGASGRAVGTGRAGAATRTALASAGGRTRGWHHLVASLATVGVGAGGECGPGHR